MLGIVLNEIDIIKNALEGKIEIGDEAKVIKLLIKYYDNLNDKNIITDGDIKLEIKERIMNVMSKCDNSFTRPKWNDFLTKNIIRYFKTKEKYGTSNNLLKIEEIKIFKEEIDIIKRLEDKKLEKLAFVMLVYCKINKELLNTDSNWINQSLNNIFKESKLNEKNEDKILLLHKLEKLGYIKTGINSKKGVPIFINYILDDGSEGIILNKFNLVVHYYLIYNGEHWKECKCEDCKKWFKLKTPNSPQIYCPSCAKKMELEKHRERNKKWYKNSNSDGK